MSFIRVSIYPCSCFSNRLMQALSCRMLHSACGAPLATGAASGAPSGAFAVKNNRQITGKRVLLVDALFTTGYTAQEASRSLLKSAAKEVIVFALARTPS